MGEIRDATLRMPLSVQAVLQASEADDAVARALLAKGTPVLARRRIEDRQEGQLAGREEGRKEGAAGLRQAIEAICEVLSIELLPDRRVLLEKASLTELQGLVQALKEHRSWPAR